MTERETLKSWLDREGITYDIDQDGGFIMGDPRHGYLSGMLRVRTEEALVIFRFREDDSLEGVMTQDYLL